MNQALFKHAQPPRVDWGRVETVILDMDGTLLDLNYDNLVWNEIVPAAYAQRIGTQLDDAKRMLLEHMSEIHGTIDFYSFEYWSDYTGLNLVDLHAAHADMIDYRPGALGFLRWLRDSGKHVIVATNAHRDSLKVKETRIPISQEVDVVVSSQDFQAPKESLEFWSCLQDLLPFDPARSFFADDNKPVLDCARAYGIAHLWTITTPDSARPPRTALSYPQFDHFEELGFI